MPVTVAASGTQNATLATDHTVVTQTAPAGGAIYQFRTRLHNLANSERLILSVQIDAESGGTLDDLYEVGFSNLQTDTYKDSPAVAVPAGARVRVILRQEGGTGRAFPWWLYRLDG